MGYSSAKHLHIESRDSGAGTLRIRSVCLRFGLLDHFVSTVFQSCHQPRTVPGPAPRPLPPAVCLGRFVLVLCVGGVFSSKVNKSSNSRRPLSRAHFHNSFEAIMQYIMTTNLLTSRNSATATAAWPRPCLAQRRGFNCARQITSSFKSFG